MINLQKHKNNLDIDMAILIDDEEVPVVLSINRGTMSIRLKGQRKRRLESEWTSIVTNMVVPNDAKSKYLNNPRSFIKGQ